jgi:ATP-dependent exoDNAse (exonuclease V) alpha subunit
LTIKLSSEQQAVVDLMEKTNEPIFITGRAGTGKTAVLRAFAKTTKKKHVVAASTGIAALNAGGQTLHRLVGVGTALPADLGVDLHKVKAKRHWLKNIRTIIIDEVSMVSADLMDSMDRNLRFITDIHDQPFGGIQIIMFGDPYQLPPVVTKEDARWYAAHKYASPWFFDAKVFHRNPFLTVELQTIFRQEDDTYKDLLNGVRDASLDREGLLMLNALGAREGRTEQALLLGSTNKIVLDRNRTRLAKLPGRTHVYTARVNTGFGRGEPAERRLELKIGAHIMMLNNDDQDRWVNGSRGEIEYCGPEDIQVRIWDTDEVHTIERHAWVPDGTPPNAYQAAPKYWQLPVKLAWAVSIHKSQGLSLPEIEIDMGQFGAFEGGMTYVALSRATDPWGVYFNQPLQMDDIMVNPHVAKFFDRLRG